MADPFAVLGLLPGASKADIKVRVGQGGVPLPVPLPLPAARALRVPPFPGRRRRSAKRRWLTIQTCEEPQGACFTQAALGCASFGSGSRRVLRL